MLSAARQYLIMRHQDCGQGITSMKGGHMGKRHSMAGTGFQGGGVVLAVAAVVMISAGCASEKPKPMAQPSLEQVKGNADRGFDKLKQEEREHKPAGM